MQLSRHVLSPAALACWTEARPVMTPAGEQIQQVEHHLVQKAAGKHFSAYMR